MKTIAELRDRHKGADIYVVGSGVSLEFYDPEFFRDRIVIAINWVADRRPLPATYTLTKYHDCALANAVKYPDTDVAVSRHLYGNPYQPTIGTNLPNLYAYDTKEGQVPGSTFNVERDWPTKANQLVNSHSSITSGMHFAAYLGAANVFMVAHDGGKLDGRMHFEGYRLVPDPNTTEAWLREFEEQSKTVKAELAKRYGVRVYGLLPFINAHLEGHA